LILMIAIACFNIVFRIDSCLQFECRILYWEGGESSPYTGESYLSVLNLFMYWNLEMPVLKRNKPRIWI
jgi:hypothetical protein